MLSLYIHVPFCVSKCHYCGFFSSLYRSDQADAYIAALSREAADAAVRIQGRSMSTLYLGGGTPTVLSAGQLGRLFAVISGSFQIASDAEWTIEANPNAMEPGLLSLARERGANRLSIGIQSFSPVLLAALGRSHTPADCRTAVDSGRGAGFQNIGLDLIYGIPGQDMTSWRDTVERAIGLGPEHISVYCLSLDPGSRYHRRSINGMLTLPDAGMAADMYDCAADLLDAAGLHGYELSNFARKGFECRHNRNYWKRGEYLGLGPGAWTFLEGRRAASAADMDEYARHVLSGRPAYDAAERITEEEAVHERLLLGLRTSEGVALSDFRLGHGEQALARLQAAVNVHAGRGLIEIRDGHLRLTRSGRLLADEVILRLCL